MATAVEVGLKPGIEAPTEQLAIAVWTLDRGFECDVRSAWTPRPYLAVIS